MACNCGSVNPYLGNCGCSDPIELICTGPTGPTGATGSAGVNGASVYLNLEHNIQYADAAVTSDIVYSYATTAPIISTNGSFLEFEGYCNFENTSATVDYDYIVILSAGAQILFNERVQCLRSTSLKVLFNSKAFLSSTYGNFFISKGSAWTDGLAGTSMKQSTEFHQRPQGAGLLDFSANFTISVTFYKLATGTGTGVNFVVKEASLDSLVITKFIK